jgi:hypothetical protein
VRPARRRGPCAPRVRARRERGRGHHRRSRRAARYRYCRPPCTYCRRRPRRSSRTGSASSPSAPTPPNLRSAAIRTRTRQTRFASGCAQSARATRRRRPAAGRAAARRRRRTSATTCSRARSPGCRKATRIRSWRPTRRGRCTMTF